MNSKLMQYQKEIQDLIAKEHEEVMRIEKTLANKQALRNQINQTMIDAMNADDMSAYKKAKHDLVDVDAEIEFYTEALNRSKNGSSNRIKDAVKKYPELIREEQQRIVTENRKKLFAIARNFVELIEQKDAEIKPGNDVIKELFDEAGLQYNDPLRTKYLFRLWGNRNLINDALKALKKIISFSDGRNPTGLSDDWVNPDNWY